MSIARLVVRVAAVVVVAAMLVACEKVSQFTVREWIDEVETDQKEAVKKYGNGKIEITGQIFGVSRIFLDPKRGRVSAIYLQTTGADLDIMWCLTADPAPWTKLTAGHKVTIRGRVEDTGYHSAKMLLDTKIIKYEGPTTHSFTPQTLTEAAAKNALSDGDEPVLGRLIVMKAVVESIAPPENSYSRRKVVFKNEGGNPMECEFEQGHHDDLESVKPGDTIEFLCRVSVGSSWLSIHSPTRIDR